MKRFWNGVTVAPGPGGFRVLLDSRPLRLPGGAKLLLAGERLAEAVAAEWRAAGGALGGEMGWDDVPLTRLVGTAQERIAPDPEPVVLEIARYGSSDLLCYRATDPEELVRRQSERWQPWLDWAEREYGIRLKVTTGVIPVTQEPAAFAALARAVASRPPLVLAALGVAVPALGSLVLGLALAAFRLDAATAFALASLDETFQAELWGRDPEAEQRHRRIQAEVEVAARLLELVAP